MDPNATLENIARKLSLSPEACPSVDNMVCDLATWIDNQGFEPDWAAHPLATHYYKTRRAQADIKVQRYLNGQL